MRSIVLSPVHVDLGETEQETLTGDMILHLSTSHTNCCGQSSEHATLAHCPASSTQRHIEGDRFSLKIGMVWSAGQLTNRRVVLGAGGADMECRMSDSRGMGCCYGIVSGDFNAHRLSGLLRIFVAYFTSHNTNLCTKNIKWRSKDDWCSDSSFCFTRVLVLSIN